MDRMSGIFDSETAFDLECQKRLRENAVDAGLRVGVLYGFICLCNLFHHILRPWFQPRITSDSILGVILGNIHEIRDWLISVPSTLDLIARFGMMLYMFVLGLEMDPYVLFRWPNRAAKVAYAGMISTFILGTALTPLFRFFKVPSILYTISLSTALCGTSSPLLTRIITSQKVGKSDIGQLVIAAGMHSDFISTLIMSIGYIAFQDTGSTSSDHIKKMAIQSISLFFQSLFTAIISPFFLNWVNNENPEGKPMKGSHMVLSVAFMLLACCSWLSGYTPILSTFMAGVFLPREGRVSKWLLGKINCLLALLYYPLFFVWMGYNARFSEFQPAHFMTWARFLVLLAIGMLGKMAGIIISGAILGFNWPESIMIGLLLTVKGHFHIFLAVIAKERHKISPSTCIVMILVIFCTFVQAPFVVSNIIKRARKRSPTQRLALEWLDPVNELRMLLCLHGPHNVSSTINFMEISRGAAEPGIVVYATDLIELTDKIAATVVRGEDNEVTVGDKAVTEMRHQVSNAFQDFEKDSGDGITVRRLLTLSAFSAMPRDICTHAEDLLISLIVLPFHKSQRADGTLDGGQQGFRYVNRKVLRHAPCSVGILVDRGFGSIEKISRQTVSLNVSVIFIGGKDDREALAYAGRVARHRGVKLTVIRFLIDKGSENSNRRPNNYRYTVAEVEAEMKLDDECFAFFYENYVAGGAVAYMEKHLANSSETLSTLKSLEGQYSLIIVGKGDRVNSFLTMGMNDLEQCPELGPVGDVLSGSDFSAMTSVLIIQQPSLKGELEGLDEDFTIM